MCVRACSPVIHELQVQQTHWGCPNVAPNNRFLALIRAHYFTLRVSARLHRIPNVCTLSVSTFNYIIAAVHVPQRVSSLPCAPHRPILVHAARVHLHESARVFRTVATARSANKRAAGTSSRLETHAGLFMKLCSGDRTRPHDHTAAVRQRHRDGHLFKLRGYGAAHVRLFDEATGAMS